MSLSSQRLLVIHMTPNSQRPLVSPMTLRSHRPVDSRMTLCILMTLKITPMSHMAIRYCMICMNYIALRGLLTLEIHTKLISHVKKQESHCNQESHSVMTGLVEPWHSGSCKAQLLKWYSAHHSWVTTTQLFNQVSLLGHGLFQLWSKESNEDIFLPRERK